MIFPEVEERPEPLWLFGRVDLRQRMLNCERVLPLKEFSQCSFGTQHSSVDCSFRSNGGMLDVTSGHGWRRVLFDVLHKPLSSLECAVLTYKHILCNERPLPSCTARDCVRAFRSIPNIINVDLGSFAKVK